MKIIRFCIFLILCFRCLNGDVGEELKELELVSGGYERCHILTQILEKKAEGVSWWQRDMARREIASFNEKVERQQRYPREPAAIMWDIYPMFVQAYSRLAGGEISLDPHYVNEGYIVGSAPRDLRKELIAAFESARRIPILTEDHDPNYTFNEALINHEPYLNRNSSYLMLENLQLQAMEKFIFSVKDRITRCLGTPWRILNVRAWFTEPSIQSDGPYAWHTDGLPFYALKIMVYPYGVSRKKGSIEIMTANGPLALENDEATWIFFKNSEISHRAIPPSEGERLAIEITLMPSIDYDLEPFCVGQNARHPILPWQYPEKNLHPTMGKDDIVGVNIGGGPHWSCPGWVNLEQFTSEANPISFHFNGHCQFPFENDSVSEFYSSHSIEHFNLPTLYRIMSEIKRCAVDGGDVVIKFPDYDKALNCWQRGDSSFFGPEWDIESLFPLWKQRGICPCLDHKASMIFASYWNHAYGNHFDPSDHRITQGAFFGPAPIATQQLRLLIQDKTPSEITKALVNAIRTTERDFQLCHQSAWSREEFQELLTMFGFEIVTFDSDKIIQEFNHIPGINEMKSMSTYCWAKKI